jgi:hypothetical protein
MRSFKLFLAGAVGITLAVSSFEACAFQLHTVGGGWARPLPNYGPARPGVSLGYRNVIGVRLNSPTAQHFAQSPGRNFNLNSQSLRPQQPQRFEPQQVQQQRFQPQQRSQQMEALDDASRARAAQNDAARISSLCRNSNQPSCNSYRPDGTYRYGDRGPLNY